MRTKYFQIVALAAAIMTIGCRKSNSDESLLSSPGSLPINGSQFRFTTSEHTERPTLLGPQKENPYTPANMRLALQTLSSNGIAAPASLTVRTTHKYVRYKPETWEQLNKLNEDTSHSYFPYPLDRDVIEEGSYYDDPALPDSTPQYQYVTVEKDFNLGTEIPYEILSELYLPELDENLDEEGRNFADLLLDQAYVQTDNYEDTVRSEGETAGKTTGLYRPSGTILIRDNILNANIGLEGPLATARRWFVVFRARPDYHGNFQVNGVFNRPCNYRVSYEAFGFNVRRNLIDGIAYVDGPKQSGPWSTIIQYGYGEYAGTVFRGAYYYHYKNVDGLSRPFSPSGRFINYIAKYGHGNTQAMNLGIIPFIYIYSQDAYSPYRYYYDNEIFSTTIHETAHTTHILVCGNNAAAFAAIQKFVRESWAVAVEWRLSALEYTSRGYPDYDRYSTNSLPSPLINFPMSYSYQYYNKNTAGSLKDYSSIFINCMDTLNEDGKNIYGSVYGVVHDSVGHGHSPHGVYNIANLENSVIRYAVNYATLKTLLKANKPTGCSDADIDALMSGY